ncbi:MAG: 4-hydroxy-3-methylbut-2-enyl diphosphate reductase [Saprospiraceae bacterium]
MPRIIITSGASCPDAVLEKVLRRLLEFFPQSKTVLKIEEGLT